MQLSRFFLVSLVAALSAIVVASADSTIDAGLVAKRAALESRMHARAHAGHGALKKRQLSAAQLESKERIRRAQYKPTKTSVAAPGLEKRSLVTYGTLGGILNGVVCPCPLGICPPGCSVPSQPKPSAVSCQGSGFDACTQTGLGGSVSGGTGYSSGGISQCCQTGYTCQQVSGLKVSVCLNVVQAFDLGQALLGQSFGTQQDSVDFLNAYKTTYNH